MPTYSVFGGCLRSDIDLPELRRTRTSVGEARWRLIVASNGHPPGDTVLLGTDDVMPGVTVQLHKVMSGEQKGAYRLTYDDTGSFLISGDGREIVWSKGDRAWDAAAQLDIINRVLPVALHASGMFCLHGSAVGLKGAGIAFLAPRFHGKSTLAMAMTRAGARILADDVVALNLQSPITAWPGVPSVRLLDDAATALIGGTEQLEAVGAYPMTRRDLHQLPSDQPFVTKQILGGLPDQQVLLEPVPLAAIYLLTPTRGDEETAAARARLAPVQAALSLVEHSKPGILLGKSEAAVLLDRAVRVARQVPVYRLTAVRDLSRIGAVAEQIIRWHQG